MKKNKYNLTFYKETKTEREERLKRDRSMKTQVIKQKRGKGSYNRYKRKTTDL